jgi:hypothetical protein
VLLQNAEKASMDLTDYDHDDYRSTPGSRANTPSVAGKGSAKAKRTSGNLASLAGGEGMAYQETNKNMNKVLRKEHHPLFKSLYKKR